MMFTQSLKWKIIIFLLTWVAYASTYLLRKPLGVIKSDLAVELSFSKTELGWLDTALLLPYATFQVVLGSLGDFYGARYTLSICLLLSAASMVMFGHWSAFHIFAFCLFLNGCAQSQAWPNCVKGLGYWYRDQRNAIFGIWGTCVFMGGIAGTGLAVYLQSQYGWRYAFTTPSFIVSVVGVFVFLFLLTPEEVKMSMNGEEYINGVRPSKPVHSPDLSMQWLQLWKIPMLPEISIATFCVKIVRYCMYMWLPMYLHQFIGYEKSEAGLLSISFEMGGVAGSAVIGYVIDRQFQGQAVLGSAICVVLSTVGLIMFLMTSELGMTCNILCMIMCGTFNCGPDPILSGTLPLEMGEMSGRNIQASLSGFINGFGSLGTVLQGPVIGYLADTYDWTSMFHFMIMMSSVGALALFKAQLVKRRQILSESSTEV
ncbi:uncharacterized protein [Ptychodera flava]|uniref:uncharacterized protein n=1 Tax=Ptychodera flava TaxID=63121 RepID=UPI003969D0D1